MLNNQSFDIEAIVLANGTYPHADIPLQLLKEAPFLIACDGATNELVRHHIIPTIIIGDGDSISPENKERFKDIFHQVADQETNDLTKAVNYLEARGMTNIAVLGATGGRDDHALGNISLLVDYMRRGIHVRMFTDYGMFIPLSGVQTLQTYQGQQVSVFNFGTKDMHSSGLKYPLYDFTNWWQGTLNEAEGDEITILAEGDYLVYLAY